MQNTKTLDQIIDKIVEKQPARLRSARRTRKIVGRTDVWRAVSRRVDAELAPSERSPKRLVLEDKLETVGKTTAKKIAFERTKMENWGELQRLSGERNGQTQSDATEARLSGDSQSKTPRRRQIDPTTCERDYSAEEVEFMKALDEYKRTSGRMFPTCSEILEVFKSLGYVKVAPTPEKTCLKRVQKTYRTSTPAFINDESDDEKIGTNDVCAPLNFA